MSDSEEDGKFGQLQEIKDIVSKEKAHGNSSFISGWDDDTSGIDPGRNPTRVRECQMLEAAEHGDIETLRRLLEEEPALLRTKDSDGYTPLHRASYNDQHHTVEYLISMGADVGAKTEDGWTPLHSACHWSNALSALKLLEGGADINAATDGGQTALHLAASHGSSKNCLEVLLMHPLLKVDLTNNAGETAVDIARRSGPYSVIFELYEPSLRVTGEQGSKTGAQP